MDGALGWSTVKQNLMQFQAIDHHVKLLRKISSVVNSWTKVAVKKDADVLLLEVPKKDGTAIIFVDTGSDHGIHLAPAKWREWTATHPNRASTMNAYYTPAAGVIAKEETWAKTLSLGPLVLEDVPIMEAQPAELAMVGTNYEATIGLVGLKRLNLIVDGRNSIAYMRPTKTAAPAYEHNRLGAVFVPADTSHDDLIAHVASNSPAHKAGIRNGDVLLKIDDLDVTDWRHDRRVLPMSRFFARGPGTKLALTLKREDRTFEVGVVLRDMLSPQDDDAQR
jgi:hypothetical protein